jgi:predicted xylose isomerase-like sugar epimerase
MIPKEILLFNQRIKIIKSRTLLQKKGLFGDCQFNKNKIYIQVSTRKHQISKEQIKQTLTHEVFHMILYHTGYHHLMNNEPFVSNVSNLIHQYIEQL